MKLLAIFFASAGVVYLCSGVTGFSLKGSDPREDILVERLEQLLFPSIGHTYNESDRRLAIAKPVYNADDPVACARCQSLSVCQILNGYRVEEVYLPLDPSARETCTVIEAFGKRIQGEIFGNGRTFRDTDQCRDIVMQYLCLFYGSNSGQYRNYCVFQEDVSDTNSANHLISARPPCRSFCVQVATVCANDPTFIHTCNRIACPPTESSCTPDPVIDTQSLAANLGCDVPYYRTPYNGATAGYTLNVKYVVFGSMTLYFLLSLACVF